MYCVKCNKKLDENAKFCGGCGSSVTGERAVEKEPTDIIKCGNCEYVGKGEPARRMVSKILAWLCVFFAPLITILYFVATNKYRCPRCKSTFLGIKNKNGVFQGQRGGAGRWVLIVFIILFGVVLLGIVATVVLASLGTARQRAADASIQAHLSILRGQAEIYSGQNQDGGYSGLCNDGKTLEILNKLPKVKNTSFVCNDSVKEFAAASQLNSGGYFCVDSAGKAEKMDAGITTQTRCSLGINNKTLEQNISWSKFTSPTDDFSILFPKYPTLDFEDDVILEGTDSTYSTHGYESDDNSNSYLVYKYIYSNGIDATNPQKVLKSYLDFMLGTDIKNKLISSSAISYKSNPALEFLISSGEEMIRGRIILVEETPYLLMMSYFEEKYDATTYNKFINSFEIN